MLYDGIKILEGSVIENLSIAAGTSFPSNANIAELFYRSDEHKLYIHNGTTWGEVGSSSGDVSSNTSSSIDSEIALFNSTTGKSIKRATTTGILKATSGVLSAATVGTDYIAPSGALGTPASGSLTNCTNLPISGINMSTNKILGRTTAGSGAVEEITIGSGLSFSGGSLSTTGGGGGGATLSTVAGSTTYYLGLSANNSGTWTDARVDTTNLYYTSGDQTLYATNFNTSSDETLKTDIHTLHGSLEVIDQLRGVGFNWKETGRKSYGVIAQELEQILPELVNTIQGKKSVNYNALIGFLIEAIKELNEQIKKLEIK